MDDSNFKIEYSRGSGPGGQHKNKVETCVKITHLLTGLTETCQETRSKLKNFKLAKSRLENRIIDLENQKLHNENNEFRKVQIKNTLRRRTYNFKTNIVTDHLTNKKASLNKVLNGNLELLL